MFNNRGKVPPMTPKTLVVLILATIAMGFFLFFVRGDMAGKTAAFIVCPALIIYLIYAYRKEKKADKNAFEKGKSIMDESYFKNSKWRTDYFIYMNEHPFEKHLYSSMKKDLLSRFRRKEYVISMLFILFLMFCSCCLMIQQLFWGIIGFLIFGIFFCRQLSLFIGIPVRKWLKRDIDYNALEYSYKNSKLLTYKKNGFALGLTHIHAFTEEKIYAIDYRLVEGISRKIVRLKNMRIVFILLRNIDILQLFMCACPKAAGFTTQRLN